MHVQISVADGSRCVQGTCQTGDQRLLSRPCVVLDAFSQLTHLIAEKEKKSSSYETAKLDSLSDEKQQKIKKFVKDYVAKILRRMRDKKSKNHRHDEKTLSSRGSPRQASSDTPNSNDSAEGLAALEIEVDGETMDVDGPEGLDTSMEVDAGDDDAEEDPWDLDKQGEMAANAKT